MVKKVYPLLSWTHRCFSQEFAKMNVHIGLYYFSTTIFQVASRMIMLFCVCWMFNYAQTLAIAAPFGLWSKMA